MAGPVNFSLSGHWNCLMTKAAPRLSRFYTKTDIAEHLGVSTRTVSRLIDAGELRAHHLGGSVRIAEEDAVSFVAARRR